MVAEALSAWHVAHLAVKFVDVVLDLRVEEVQPALACSLGSFVQVLTVSGLVCQHLAAGDQQSGITKTCRLQLQCWFVSTTFW